MYANANIQKRNKQNAHPQTRNIEEQHWILLLYCCVCTIHCVCYPLHRYEFGPPKFFSKSFKFSIIFYSTWQISGGGQWRKACRSREKESIQSEITWKQSEPVRSISKIEKRREFVRALWYEQCPKNSFKRLYTFKGLMVLSKKLRFQKNFGRNFIAVEGVMYLDSYM